LVVNITNLNIDGVYLKPADGAGGGLVHFSTSYPTNL